MIAESVIRSAGIALIASNKAKAKQLSQEFMRSLLAQVIYNPAIALEENL